MAKERTLRADPHIDSFDQADNDKYQALSFCGDEGFWTAKDRTPFDQADNDKYQTLSFCGDEGYWLACTHKDQALSFIGDEGLR